MDNFTNLGGQKTSTGVFTRMRKRGRVDGPQKAIVKALRQCGVRVEILSGLGHGVPDLMCAAKHGPITLLEIKDGSKPPSQQRLTQDEQEWHSMWHEHVFVVNSVESALKALNL